MIEVAFAEFKRDGDHGELRCQKCGTWIPATVASEGEDGSVLLHLVQCKQPHFAWFPTGGLLKHPPKHPNAGQPILSPLGLEQPGMEKRSTPGCDFAGEVKVLAYVYVDPGEVLEIRTHDGVGTKDKLV